MSTKQAETQLYTIAINNEQRIALILIEAQVTSCEVYLDPILSPDANPLKAHRSPHFHIGIDEPQRLALLALIEASGADRTEAPLEYWEGMLKDLPKEEDAFTAIHGFCF